MFVLNMRPKKVWGATVATYRLHQGSMTYSTKRL